MTTLLIMLMLLVASPALAANVAEQTTTPSFFGLKIPSLTFAQLPTCNSSNDGIYEPVSDSTTSTFGQAITGGGTGIPVVLARCNGATSQWLVATGGASTTTCGGTNQPPCPPALVNPVVIQPGAVLGAPMNCTIAGNGTYGGGGTDDGACIQAALNAGHDIDMRDGTYLLSAKQTEPGNETASIMMPAGRNFRCPAWTTTPRAIMVDLHSGGSTFLFFGNNGEHNSTIFNCGFRGQNADVAAPNYVAGGAQEFTFFVKFDQGANNNTIVGDDFNGPIGDCAVEAYSGGSQNPFIGEHVDWNRVEHAGLYGICYAGNGHGNTASHNVLVDASCCRENNPTDTDGGTDVYDSNVLVFNQSPGAGTHNACNNGTVPCANAATMTGGGINYSTLTYANNVVSNNVVIGTNAIWDGITGHTSLAEYQLVNSSIDAKYYNNVATGSNSRWANNPGSAACPNPIPPGNASCGNSP